MGVTEAKTHLMKLSVLCDLLVPLVLPPPVPRLDGLHQAQADAVLHRGQAACSEVEGAHAPLCLRPAGSFEMAGDVLTLSALLSRQGCL